MLIFRSSLVSYIPLGSDVNSREHCSFLSCLCTLTISFTCLGCQNPQGSPVLCPPDCPVLCPPGSPVLCPQILLYCAHQTLVLNPYLQLNTQFYSKPSSPLSTTSSFGLHDPLNIPQLKHQSAIVFIPIAMYVRHLLHRLLYVNIIYYSQYPVPRGKKLEW